MNAVADSCQQCGGMRFVIPVHDSVAGRAVPCRCFQSELTQRRQRSPIADKPISPRLQRMTFASFVSTNAAEQHAYRVCRSFAHEPAGWLLLAGSSSAQAARQALHLAAAIANQRHALRQPALLTTTADLLDSLRATFDTGGYAAAFDAVCRVPLLILTDVGCEHQTGWAREKVYQVVNGRYLEEMALVVSTPLPLIQLNDWSSQWSDRGSHIDVVEL